jgi:hypothetical protein
MKQLPQIIITDQRSVFSGLWKEFFTSKLTLRVPQWGQSRLKIGIGDLAKEEILA